MFHAIRAEARTSTCWFLAEYFMKQIKWGVSAILRIMKVPFFIFPIPITSDAESWCLLPSKANLGHVCVVKED